MLLPVVVSNFGKHLMEYFAMFSWCRFAGVEQFIDPMSL
jgi:hypothetical protein